MVDKPYTPTTPSDTGVVPDSGIITDRASKQYGLLGQPTPIVQDSSMGKTFIDEVKTFADNKTQEQTDQQGIKQGAYNDAISKAYDPTGKTDASGMDKQYQSWLAKGAQGSFADFAKGAGATSNKSGAVSDIENISKQSDTMFQDFKSAVDTINNGTFKLSLEEQNQIDQLQAQYAKLEAQQKVYNQNFEAGTTQLGITSGRQRYASELNLQNIQQATSAG